MNHTYTILLIVFIGVASSHLMVSLIADVSLQVTNERISVVAQTLIVLVVYLILSKSRITKR